MTAMACLYYLAFVERATRSQIVEFFTEPVLYFGFALLSICGIAFVVLINTINKRIGNKSDEK
jgi:hypothetical protein